MKIKNFLYNSWIHRFLIKNSFFHYFLIILHFSINIYSAELFWETPKILNSNARFPKFESNNEKIVIVWQEYKNVKEKSGEIFLSLAVTKNGKEWNIVKDFAGPFNFTGDEAPIFSLVLAKDGTIFTAVAAAENLIKIFSSNDDGNTINLLSEINTEKSVVAPRLFVKNDGQFILYAMQEFEKENLSIFYSLSENGSAWTNFKPLATEANLKINYLPYHISFNNKEYVIFQSLITERRSSYQLYLKISSNGARSWSNAIELTNFTNYGDEENATKINYDNQRGFLQDLGDRIGITWEREKKGGTPQIFYMSINPDGVILDNPEKISHGSRSCFYPRIFSYNKTLYLTWFDNRRGDNTIILAEKKGASWIDNEISSSSGSSTFGHALINNNILYIFWENKYGNSNNIVMLGPDNSAPNPEIIPIDFTPEKRTRRNQFSVKWDSLNDSSGIEGYTCFIDNKKKGTVPADIEILNSPGVQRRASFSVENDGEWYIHLFAKDYAGNWSEGSSISLFRDTTPPEKVRFRQLEIDNDGYLSSNSFSIKWDPPKGEEISGYSYKLQFINEEQISIKSDDSSLINPSESIISETDTASFNNQDNGFWVFSARAIDSVGNAGEINRVFFKLNKYIPVTYITDIQKGYDDLNRTMLNIYGRGFSESGDVELIILDTDKKPPYDYSFSLSSKSFSVKSDKLIKGPVLEEIDEGTYLIGVVHPARGLYFTNDGVYIEPAGTVKFGDYRNLLSNKYKIEKISFSISLNVIFLYLLVFFAFIIFIISVQRVSSVYNEGVLLNKEIQVLIRGGEMPLLGQKETIQKMIKHGMGLRLKFAVIIMMLVFAVVLMISIPLGSFMISTQKKNLAQALVQNVNVLLKGVSSGVRTYLPSKNTLELGLLPAQKSAIDGAKYITITSQGETSGLSFDYVWASDDPDIKKKIDTPELVPGLSRIKDPISEDVEASAENINKLADEKVKSIVEELEKLESEALRLLYKQGTDAERRLAEIQEDITSKERVVNGRLSEIADIIESKPFFNIKKLSYKEKNYLFFKPIIYRTPQDKTYFRGTVRMGISIENIIKQIISSRNRLVLITLGIAAIAIGLGAIGALILASIIIIPIKRLAAGVGVIRDTEDKEKLKNHEIIVNTKDEIENLADTINQMTQGLVKAAAANKELIVGKEVQKMFIPLDKDSSGNKLSTGKLSNNFIEFFGYYEGAKGVSGDYFDFLKIDEKHYALIKCDVAGKGVPAALIMVEVATIFLNYFRDKVFDEKNIQLNKLVYTMNDLIEERGFQGRFAALIVAIINIETGKLYMCNAGDNIVHFFEKSKNQMSVKNLQETPAAGVFPSMLVEMQKGFKQEIHKLNTGDTLFLFTDGIEEAKRHFRDTNFKPIKCDEPGLKDGETHETHAKTSPDEELGIQRIHAILNSVFNKGKFNLIKYHNPIPDEQLQFDFTNCESSVEEAILSLVSVEKIFRIYPDPNAGSSNRIMIDKKIDGFLKKHFIQYNEYFKYPLEIQGPSEYLYFTNLKEDEQYDDLTILGIRKK